MSAIKEEAGWISQMSRLCLSLFPWWKYYIQTLLLLIGAIAGQVVVEYIELRLQIVVNVSIPLEN